MKHLVMLPISLLCVLLTGNVALAAEASVTIHSPTDGAKLDVMEQNRVDYEVVPGPSGDHTHAVVDGKETAILRQLKGSYTLESLAPGSHEICIRVVNKNHTPIGVEKCINVIVE